MADQPEPVSTSQRKMLNWPNNTHVIGSMGQDSEGTGQDFLQGIFNRLSDRTASSIVDAYRKGDLKAKVLIDGDKNPTLLQYVPPNVEGPSRNISVDTMWQLNQRDIPRQMLVIVGSTKPGQDPTIFEEEIAIANKISKQFGLKEDQIQVLRQPNTAQVTAAMERLSNFSNTNKNAELLVVVECTGRRRTIF